MGIPKTYIQEEQEVLAPMKVVRNEKRVFNTRYLRSLNLLTVRGWSVTNDAWVKYCQILGDIEGHLKTSDTLNIYFKLELFNSSSAKYLMKIIKRLNKASKEGKKVKIFWSCNTENEDEMIDMGMDLKMMCQFPFEVSYL